MTAAEWRATQVRLLSRNVLPPVTECDYDIGPGAGFPNGAFAGEIPWLVGGNELDQLPEVPADGFFDFGIDVAAPLDPLASPELAALANAGIDIITAGEERIRIFGTAADDPEYQDCMEGRVLIANGFIENEECPAELVLIPAGDGIIAPPGFADAPFGLANIYLERPSNSYNVVIDDADILALPLVPEFDEDFVTLLEAALAPFALNPAEPFTSAAFDLFLIAAAAGLGPDSTPAEEVAAANLAALVAITGLTGDAFITFVLEALPFLDLGLEPGQRVLFINEIFLGDAPVTTATSVATYDPLAAVPLATGIGSQLYAELGIDTFDYLLKIINTSTADVAIIFNNGDPGFLISGRPAAELLTADYAFYSNANPGGAGFFLVESGGAGFFEMRVEDGEAHIMTHNVQYTQYIEPELVV